MNANDKKKLQQLIDKNVKAHNNSLEASSELDSFCDALYGFSPSDKGMDQIIDAVYGGCGLSYGMSAEKFDQEMNGWYNDER